MCLAIACCTSRYEALWAPTIGSEKGGLHAANAATVNGKTSEKKKPPFEGGKLVKYVAREGLFLRRAKELEWLKREAELLQGLARMQLQ